MTNGSEPDKKPSINPILGAIVLFALAFMAMPLFLGNQASQTIPYSAFKSQIEDGTIREVTLTQTTIVGVFGGVENDGVTQLRAVLPVQNDPELFPLLADNDVSVTAVNSGDGSIIGALFPWIIVIGFYIWFIRRMRSGMTGLPGGVGDLMSGRFMKPANPAQKITFDDVAGQDTAKREVSELVEFLRDPERFARVGAEVPHGVLLMGPPGTGKTLLARALAGEADVPFFSTTGSEFIEVFVGVGAGRVRKMFEAARKAAPAIIFIDELDSIGRTRGTGVGGGHDEREQTLNQILAELDGFSGKEAVVVLAATNRPDVLDPALLRPGRFDRHVTLNLPDKAARRAILDIHAKGLPIAKNVDLDTIAAGTPGFSGADLKNLLNEAAISAARTSAHEIQPIDIDEARDKVMMGTVRTLAIQPDERHRLAVHEAGHTAVAHFLPEADPLYKVTIIPRGQALGGTHMLPENERQTLPEPYLQGQLTTLLAGRAAERLLMTSVSSGADDDIRRATTIARSMVARWGMDNEIGPIDLRDSDDHPFLGQTIAKPRNFADATAARVDAAVQVLLKAAEAKATEILTHHKDKVLVLATTLEQEETLDANAIRKCLDPDNVTPLHDRSVPI
ncbi:MAG: ATP-dependent zinc metalloprotease FtsH [Yoonia sp.]|nr:ATP-dependent zinc metalloprotease FtsH [Yoonia sp.]